MISPRNNSIRTRLLIPAVSVLTSFVFAHADPLPDLPAKPKVAWELDLTGGDLGETLQRNSLTANPSAMLEGAMEVLESDDLFDSPVLRVVDLDERGVPLLRLDLSPWSSEGRGALEIDFRAARDTGNSLTGQFSLASGSLAEGSELLSIAILGKDVVIKEGGLRLGSDGREELKKPLGRKGSAQMLRLVISWYPDSNGSQKADVLIEAADGSSATAAGLPLEQQPQQLQIRAGKQADADGRGFVISRIRGFSEPFTNDAR